MIHLDTSFLIRAFASGSPEDTALRNWRRERTTLSISSIAWAEFLCGPTNARVHELASSLFREVVPFGIEEASVAADLFNASGRRRHTLADCMVAATAITSQAKLATSNTADFKRFVSSGLVLF